MTLPSDLTAQGLRELISYDAADGVFRWLLRPANCIKVGDVAGCARGRGYVAIALFGRTYMAHRLAWVHVHGTWPEGQIDHIDGNRANNAISNLRDVSQSVNMQNQRRARSDSSHGFLGVSRNGKRWGAKIVTDGRNCHLGTFDTPELAHVAYLDAKRRMHPGSTL